MRVGEDRSFLNRCFPLLLVPDGVGEGLEIDRAARVFPAFQNPDNRTVTPAIRVFRLLIGIFDSLQCLVGSRCQYFVRFQLVCNLLRTSALHTQGENSFHHIGGNWINLPAGWIFRVFQITIRHIDCQRHTSLALGFLHRSDFAAGISRIELISQPRIKNDGLCFDITDEIIVDVNIAFLVIVHAIAFADLNFLNQPHQRGTV